MTNDRYADGYRAAARYYKNRAALQDKAIDAWTNPDHEKVQGLVRKHWPALSVALDRMRDAR